MKKYQVRTKGFTLIELMVVIAIIAILATIGLVTYSNAQKSSRDARRKDDLKQIAVALELYKQSNGHFPKAYWHLADPYGNTYVLSYSTDTSHTPWIAGITSYINILPQDPMNQNAYNYEYYTAGTCSTSGSCCDKPPSYLLDATMENPQNENFTSILPSGGFVTCGGGAVTVNVDPPENRYGIIGE